ncbi:MAG: hypothetical protein JWO13_1716 [Acidobacteriales bacterium]|nr:hypothetical protein [Terriglobales bacterium]
MATLLRTVKDVLRPLPGLRIAYHNCIVFADYLKYTFTIDDDCRIGDKWDFTAPAELFRHRVAIDAVKKIRGDEWGDVLEVGCESGVFTQQLAPIVRSLTACDVSASSCQTASESCAKFLNVEVLNLNILKQDINKQFDLVFLMGVFCYFKGNARKLRVAAKLTNALRHGGLLLVQEMRLPPDIENSSWVRWFGEGGLEIRNFFNRTPGLKVTHEQLDRDYITVLYEKSNDAPAPKRWKDFVPGFLKTIYRNCQLARALSNDLDLSNTRSARDWLQAFKIIARVQRRSLIGVHGLKQLFDLILALDRAAIAGDIVECGVYRGGSASVMGSLFTASPCDRHLWLFDSFQGLPKPSAADGPSAAALENKLPSDEHLVRQLLLDCGTPPEKFHIYAGWFSDTLAKAPIEQIALLHIDADWYDSIKQCLEHFYDMVVSGGVIVLDDYTDWPGCKTALDEFAVSRGLQFHLEGGGKAPYFFRKQ